ncbi:phage terminase large subunit [Candidatus Pacearchaeota archaeon]|nr:phage terminase large subunit [Candidatus Pacearchaeota archaeon]
MIKFDWRLFNPLYWHIIDAMANEDIRYIFAYGGSSSSKTYSFKQALINDALENQESCLSMRKYSVDLSSSTYADAKGIGQKIDTITNNFQFQINKIKIGNAQMRFRGLDQSHKLQGISKFKRLYADEITHFTFDDFKQMKKRLRGKPGQQIMASWNPISVNHWINKKVIEKEEWTTLPNELPGNKRSKLYNDGTIEENSFKKINKKGNTLLIKTTYRDNWWIVGHPTKKKLPSGKAYGFIDKHVLDDFAYDKIHNPIDHDIYANGNWGILTDRLAFRPSEWSIIDEIPDKAKRIPSGLDFGWNPDPTAVCDFYIYENYLIWDELVYETELNNARQFDKEGNEVGKSIQERLEDQGFDKNHLIVAESQERKSIEELRIAGFNIHAVKKKGVIEGVKLLKKYKHLITRHSANVIYEFRNYQKCVDRDGNILNEYMDENNHHMDLSRYVQFMKGMLW